LIDVQGLLLILEYCLSSIIQNHEIFEYFVSMLGYNSVAFWRLAVPLLFDSDLSNATSYRDALLFSLALYDVNSLFDKIIV
jgi:hypothetical protein